MITYMAPDFDAPVADMKIYMELGQADKPMFRYWPQGSKTYHVIHGDLAVMSSPARSRNDRRGETSQP
jgi:hypothetical protein